MIRLSGIATHRVLNSTRSCLACRSLNAEPGTISTSIFLIGLISIISFHNLEFEASSTSDFTSEPTILAVVQSSKSCSLRL